MKRKIIKALPFLTAGFIYAQIAEEALPSGRIIGPPPVVSQAFKLEYRLRAPGVVPSLPSLPDGLALDSSTIIPYTIEGGRKAYVLMLELIASKPGPYRIEPLRDRETDAPISEAFKFIISPSGGVVDNDDLPGNRLVVARWSAPEKAIVGQTINVTLLLPFELGYRQVSSAFSAPEGMLLEVQGAGNSATWRFAITPLREGRLFLLSRNIQSGESIISIPDLTFLVERELESAPRVSIKPSEEIFQDLVPSTIALLATIGPRAGPLWIDVVLTAVAVILTLAAFGLLVIPKARRGSVRRGAIIGFGVSAAIALAIVLFHDREYAMWLEVIRGGAVLDVPSESGRVVALVEEGQRLISFRKARDYWLIQTDEGIRAWALGAD